MIHISGKWSGNHLSVLKEFGEADNVQKYSNYKQLENQVVVKGICTFKDWGRMIF